jgi:hypothetical protein
VGSVFPATVRPASRQTGSSCIRSSASRAFRKGPGTSDVSPPSAPSPTDAAGGTYLRQSDRRTAAPHPSPRESAASPRGKTKGGAARDGLARPVSDSTGFPIDSSVKLSNDRICRKERGLRADASCNPMQSARQSCAVHVRPVDVATGGGERASLHARDCGFPGLRRVGQASLSPEPAHRLLSQRRGGRSGITANSKNVGCASSVARLWRSCLFAGVLSAQRLVQPGVQTPNKPDGRDAPPPPERRS